MVRVELGNAKRHFEALEVLYELGFKEELIDFCNQYDSKRGGKLGNN